MKIIHQDIKHNRTEDRDVKEDVIRREVNGNDTFEFLTFDHNNFAKEDYILFQYGGKWREYIVKQIEKNRSGTKIYCENSIIELLTDPVEDKRVEGGSAYTALTKALESSRWSAGLVQSDVNKNWNSYHESVYDAIRSIMETWGLELQTVITVSGQQVTSRQINLVQSIGRDRGKRFEYSKNLTNVTKTVKNSDVVTALYGYGKGELLPSGGYSRRMSFADINGGLPYVADETARLQWGRPDGNGGMVHRFGFAIFENATTMQELKALTEAELDKRKDPIVEYATDVAVIAHDDELGDLVSVVDHELGIAVKARITAQEIHPDTKQIAQTIGNYYGEPSPIKTIAAKASAAAVAPVMEIVEQQQEFIIDSKGNRINYGSVTPETASVDDVWYRENNDGTIDMLKWNGSQWIDVLADLGGAALDGRLDQAEADIQAQGGQIENLGETIQQTSSDITAINADISAIDQAQEAITQRVGQVESGLDGKASVASVTTLEQTAQGLTTRVGQVETGLDGKASNTRVAAVEQTANGLSSRVSAVESGKADVTRVSALEQTATAITTTVTEMKANATNLVNDVSTSKALIDTAGRSWSLMGSGGVVKWGQYQVGAGVNNQATYALRLYSTGSAFLLSNLFEIDPLKAYRFTVWMRSNRNTGIAGSDFFGLLTYDADNTLTAVQAVASSTGIVSAGTTNPYFKIFTNTTPSAWTEVTAYLVPNSTDSNRLIGIGKNVTSHFIMGNDTRKARFRILNYYNSSASELIIANPIVTEVDADTLETTHGFQSIVEQTADRYRVKAANIDLEGLVSVINTSTGDATRISGAGIRTGTIQAQHMTVDSAMVQKLTAGNLLADEIWAKRLSTQYLTSEFIKGKYGIVDTIQANSGTIGGWAINQQSLSSASGGSFFTFNNVEYAKANGFNIIEAGSGSNFYFRVASDGKITAEGGTIGGWDITSTNLRSKATGRGQIDLHDGSQAGWALLNVTNSAGESTFKIMPDGSFSAANGTIANWTVINNTIKSESSTGFLKLNSAATGWAMIEAGKGSDTTFKVMPDGTMSCTKAIIDGTTITASTFAGTGSGTFSGTHTGSHSGSASLTSGSYAGTHTGSHSGSGSFNSGAKIGGTPIYGDGNYIQVSEVYTNSIYVRGGLRGVQIINDGVQYQLANLSNFARVSDIRSKKEISTIGSELNDDIYNMDENSIISYKLRKSPFDDFEIGFNANLLAKTTSKKFRDHVLRFDEIEQRYRVAYDSAFMVLIRTIQDLNKRVKELEK